MTTTTKAGITPEARALLRAPFAASAIKWVPVGGVIGGNAIMLMPYINASLVFERLSQVDPSWSHETRPMLLGMNAADPFGLQHGSPWSCSLTVLGVTRHGLGQLTMPYKAPSGGDDKHLKTGYSDAIKRAALEFEVGAYLRAIDSLFLKNAGTEMFKVKEWQQKMQYRGLTAGGKTAMRTAYEKIVTHPEFVKRYGEAVEYGDVAAELDDDHDAPPMIDAQTEAVDDLQADVLILLAGYNGRGTTEDTVRETLAGKPFARCLGQMLSSVSANLAVEVEDAERLRTTSIRAAEGDEAAFKELQDGLEQLQAIADAAKESAS